MKKTITQNQLEHILGINPQGILGTNLQPTYHFEKLIQCDNNFEDNYILLFVMHPDFDLSRGQVEFCHNLRLNLFRKRNSPCKEYFIDAEVKRQLIGYCLPGICNITSRDFVHAILTYRVDK